MAGDYLSSILNKQNQRKVTGGGTLTPGQVEAAFQGDIAARYQAEAASKGVALQEKQLALSERAQNSSEVNAANQLALSKESLAQQGRLSEEQLAQNARSIDLNVESQEAQIKAGNIQSGVSAIGAIGQSALLYKMYGGGTSALAGAGTSGAQIAYTGAGLASEGVAGAGTIGGGQALSLTGNTTGTYITGAPAYMGSGASITAPASELGGIFGSGLTYTGAGYAGAAGAATATLLDVAHKDSTENLGHNVTFGLVENEKTASQVGGGVAGAVAGAIAGAAATSWSGPGAIVGGIVGGIAGALSKSSWICTEIDNRCGVEDIDKKAMSKLRRYSIINHKENTRKYIKYGYLLIEKMNNKDGIEAEYETLRTTLIKNVCDLVRNGDIEKAYKLYESIVLNLCEKYNVIV